MTNPVNPYMKNQCPLHTPWHRRGDTRSRLALSAHCHQTEAWRSHECLSALPVSRLEISSTMLDEEIRKYIKPNMAYFRRVRVVSDQYKNKQTNKQKPYKTYQSTAPRGKGGKAVVFPFISANGVLYGRSIALSLSAKTVLYKIQDPFKWRKKGQGATSQLDPDGNSFVSWRITTIDLQPTPQIV